MLNATKPRISLIISSLRPEKIEWSLQKLQRFEGEIEVVVASPFPIESRAFLKWVPVPGGFEGLDFRDRELRGELSLAEKYNLSLLHSSADYIVFNNDDLEIEGEWVPDLLKHMDEMTKQYSPYLCCFTNSFQGIRVGNYSIFGKLYAHQGCISRRDLARIGGYLYDSRMRTEYVDPDLSLRVWEAGGRVAICNKINVKTDFYTKRVRLPSTDDPVCSPYKTYWAIADAHEFFKKWRKKIDFTLIRRFSLDDSQFDTSVKLIKKSIFLNNNYLLICHILIFCSKLFLGSNHGFVINLKVKMLRACNRRLKIHDS